MSKAFKFVTWQDIEKSCLSIYSRMCFDGYKPESIIALFRGGIIPGRLFSDYFNILLDFFALDVTLYATIGIKRDKLTIAPFQGDIKGKKILIIDDIWDSGETMKAALGHLNEENVTTATVFWKETAIEKPTYYAEEVKEEEWIVFPWETYEFWREVNAKND